MNAEDVLAKLYKYMKKIFYEIKNNLKYTLLFHVIIIQ